MGPKSLIVFLFLFSVPLNLWGASCCGGGGSLPNLITGDFQGKVSLSWKNTAVTHEVTPNGDSTSRNENFQETAETFQLGGSYLLSPLFQIGLEVPVVYNVKKVSGERESSTGLGDLSFQVAYEFLPEYSFSYWKPRGFLFISQSIPTSKSTFDSKKPFRTDVSGKGFYMTSLGLSFFKVVGEFDLTLAGEIHQGPKRKFVINGLRREVDPGSGISTSFGFGHNPGSSSFRWGTVLKYSFEEGQEVLGVSDSGLEKNYHWELGIQLSYLISKYSFQMAYFDQTLFNKASNTTLTKSLSLRIVRNFDL